MTDTKQKNWQEMLQDVEQRRAAYAEDLKRSGQIADKLVTRLHDVFNGKAANRLLPAVTKTARKKQIATLREGIELCNQIMDKILSNEISVEGLSLIAAHARDITPVNDMMMGMLQPVAYAAYRAMENRIPEWEKKNDAWQSETRRAELAVFERYLAERPDAAAILNDMTRSIYVPAGTEKDAAYQAVAKETQHILRSSFMLAVEVIPFNHKDNPQTNYHLISGEDGILHKTVKAHLAP